MRLPEEILFQFVTVLVRGKDDVNFERILGDALLLSTWGVIFVFQRTHQEGVFSVRTRYFMPRR